MTAAALTGPPLRRPLVLSLLAVSLGCNIASLLVPFLDLRIGLGTTPYTLLRSVEMLWHSGLYVLAVLVVGFSVLFPFAKLAILARICTAPAFTDAHRRRLALVERLGKWSMLDVFLVCLILGLTSGQLFVGAEPRVGIPLFVAAIVLNMLAGELLSAALARSTAPPAPRPPAHAGLWLALSGVALAGTISLPFLRISDWLLSDNAYSILGLVPTLWAQGSILASLLTATFLILAPVLAWAATWAWWSRRRRGLDDGPSHDRLLLLRRWSMLDVFGLALAIFLVEGDYIMDTRIQWGGLCLVGLLALQRLFQAALDRSLARRPAAAP